MYWQINLKGETMAKKSFSFSLPGIIFMVVMYNFIFDDDNKNEVEIVEQENIIQTEPAPSAPTIKDSLKEIGLELREVGEQLKDEVSVVVDDLKKELEETPPKPDEKVEEEKVIVQKEEAPDPLPEPKEESTGMKKL